MLKADLAKITLRERLPLLKDSRIFIESKTFITTGYVFFLILLSFQVEWLMSSLYSFISFVFSRSFRTISNILPLQRPLIPKLLGCRSCSGRQLETLSFSFSLLCIRFLFFDVFQLANWCWSLFGFFSLVIFFFFVGFTFLRPHVFGSWFFFYFYF